MRTEAPKDCATRLLQNSDEYITKVGAFLWLLQTHSKIRVINKNQNIRRKEDEEKSVHQSAVFGFVG